MNKQSPLTLCLIVKNESKYLKKCVYSVQDIVSKVIIVDTGSDDDTFEIARSLTPHVSRIPFDNDFSKARNYALKYVETPWILFLDADESFDPCDAEMLLECVKNTPDNVWGYDLTRYNFFGTGGWYTSKNLKVFRNSSQISYEGTVSESVTQSIKRGGGKISLAPVLLNHFGHCRGITQRNIKANFYLNLMQAEILENPGNSRLMGYVGMILRTLGRFEEALKTVDKAVEIAPQSSHAHYCKAQVLRSIGDDTKALEHYKLALQFNPEDPTAWNMVGLMHMSLGDYKEAEYAFNKTHQLNPLLIHPHVNIGLLYQAQGDDHKALIHFEKVAQRNSGFLHEDFSTRIECDPYREFYYETIFKYCGLGYHISYCREKIRRKSDVFCHGYVHAEAKL